MIRTVDEHEAREIVTEALTALGRIHLVSAAVDSLVAGSRVWTGDGHYVERVSMTEYETNAGG